MYPINYYCVSKGRSRNVERMIGFFGEDLIFVVPDSEKQAYLDAGAKNIVCPDREGLCNARNCALSHAFWNERACCQTDDDLKAVKDHRGNSVDPKKAVEELSRIMGDTNFSLGGFPPTDNPFYAKSDSTRGFIVASIMLCFPTDLRFDTCLRTKEDYDLSLQHIKKYGGVYRLAKYLWTYEHYTNEGGVVADRTLGIEHDSIKKLREKWGSIIQMNPKRPGEIRLSFKKKSD